MNQVNTLVTKLQALATDLAFGLLEREMAIQAALLALLTGEHILFLGPPGTAKSLLARGLCARIEGGCYFERLLTRFSTPEELFGPLSIAALEHDTYCRVTSGTLVEAHVAFLDEVFKANSSILNCLLGLMNERVYHENGQAQPVPLLSLVGASNELPEDSSLAALFDRFLLRVQLPYLADDASFAALLDLEPKAPGACVTIDELKAAQDLVRKVPLSQNARDALLTLRHELAAEGVQASDRRWAACARLVKARAWLEGESEALSDHAEVLVHALWSEPAQARTVERVVGKVTNPLALEAVELEDAAKDLFDQKPKADQADLAPALEPLLRQLADIHTRLEQRIVQAPERRTFRAKQALGSIETWHRELGRLALKSISRLHVAPGGA
ncbi:MAG TPA: AAA family ATPase [Verrucomicrobiota bacterium]|nr:AAA family ATPase [Verrucomicrobiota bacterium]